MRFIVNGVRYEFDNRTITFAEGKAVEKKLDRTMAEIERTKADDLGAMQGLVWVAMKRQDPTLKFEDLEDMPVADVEFVEEDDVEPDADGQDGPDPADPTPDDVEQLEGSTSSD